MRPTPLQSRLSHRLRRVALAALTLLALLATLPPTPPVGANETAPTPPTWLHISASPGLYEHFPSRIFVGRETAPPPQWQFSSDFGREIIVNRPAPPGVAPIRFPGLAVMNDNINVDGDPWADGKLQEINGRRVACPTDYVWLTPPNNRKLFHYWSAGHWSRFGVWSSQTVNGQTTWTKNADFWSFRTTGGACDPNVTYLAPTPTRLPGQPTPTPLPTLAPTSRVPTPYPTNTPNLACVAVPHPLRLTLRVSRDNGNTWTDYAYRRLGWRTDYLLDEYWSAQGGQLTLDDLPPPGFNGDPSMRFPHERTWLVPPLVQAGDLVEAVFEIERADLLGAPYGFYSPYHREHWRHFIIALMEMGADYAPGGNGENADRLLMWLAAGNPGTVEDLTDIVVEKRWQDVALGWYVQTLNHPLGFQAFLASGVTPAHGAVFATLDGRTRANWPNEGAGIIALRPTQASPNGESLRFRFRVEEGKLYRMLARTHMRRPGCPPPGQAEYPPGGFWTANTFSQLAFGDPRSERDQPLLDLEVEREGATAIAVGTQADYDITVRNVSRDPVTSTTTLLTETLPLGVTILSVQDVTDPANPQAVVEEARGNDGTFQWRRWNLGALPQGASRRLRVRIRAEPQAPDSFPKIAETFPAPPQKDIDPENNRREATMRVLRANVRAGIAAPRLARPGDEFTVTARAINTTPQAPARDVRLRLTLPFGVTLVDAGGGDAVDNAVEWTVSQLNGGATLERTVRVRALREDEASALPAALNFVASATTAAGYDSDPTDNEARGMTALLVVPRPSGELRMRIHSEFDRTRQVHRTDGTAFAWPIGETLYFLPEVTLRAPAAPNPPIYMVRQRVVAWSFVGSGEMTVNGAACKARETPPAAETAHADLSRMRGCAYRYRDDAGADEMRNQGRLYWAPFAPETMAGATYVIAPLPPSPTTIRIQYAVLVELVENGTYDLDEDGRSDSVLERRTFVQDGTYVTTLVAPRDAR